VSAISFDATPHFRCCIADHQLLADWGVNEVELTVFVLHEVITHVRGCRFFSFPRHLTRLGHLLAARFLF
jgi:hypothetical protein